MNEVPALNLLLGQLILERVQFEDELYDFLVDDMFIPDEFWEPVIVNLTKQQIDLLKNKLNDDECNICTTTNSSFKLLECCGKDMCIDCSTNWFNRSTKCPFCNHDIRTLI